MNLSFFKKPLGLAIIAGVILVTLIVAILLVGDSKKPVATSQNLAGKEWTTKDNLTQNYSDSSISYGVSKTPEKKATDEAKPTTTIQGQKPPTEAQQKVVMPMRVYATPTQQNEEKTIEEALLKKRLTPYGRLLKCSLINAVDSSNLESPVIGVVTQDLVWDGKVIIPRDTEIHGFAKGVTKLRDRIGCDENWTLVLNEPKYKNRRELLLKGIVLDKEHNPETNTFGLTDGSAGLRGIVIDNTEGKEYKLFMASFLSGVSQSFQNTSTNALGTVQVLPNARNAALGGVSNVMNEYASQIREAIARDGVFIRVYASKEFYIYVTQDIDLDAAKIGGKTLEALKKNQRK